MFIFMKAVSSIRGKVNFQYMSRYLIRNYKNKSIITSDSLHNLRSCKKIHMMETDGWSYLHFPALSACLMGTINRALNREQVNNFSAHSVLHSSIFRYKVALIWMGRKTFICNI